MWFVSAYAITMAVPAPYLRIVPFFRTPRSVGDACMLNPRQVTVSKRRKKITPKLVDRRRILVTVIALISIALVPLVLRITLDRTLKSAYVTSSPAYALYRNYLKVFGDDEFLLVAIKNKKGADDPTLLEALKTITSKLEAFPEVAQVVSLSGLKLFRERKGVFGNYPLVEERSGELRLLDARELDRITKALPVTRFLLSPDRLTVGIMIRLHDQWRFHPDLGKLEERIRRTVGESLPSGAEFRMTGAALIRDQVQHITVRTAIIYGVLCTLVVVLATLYIFKSFSVAFITLGVIGVSIEWVLGLMAALGIPLNSTTSLIFGLVLVISVATVIHIVTHYYESSQVIEDRLEAVRHAMAVVGRPCIMCALTTSVAFSTIMVSTIPMVQQLGFVMAVGVLISFVLAMVLTPAFLIALKPVDQRTQTKISQDWVSWIFLGLERFVFRRYRLCALGSIVFTVLMFAGAPLIKIDTQILRLFVDSSPVLADIRFVGENLAPIRSLELVTAAEDGTFKQPETWSKVEQMERRLAEIPEVDSVDSPLPLFRYVHTLMSQKGADQRKLFTEPGIIAQMVQVIAMNAEGRQLIRHYFNPTLGSLHLSVRIKHSADTPMGDIIDKIQSVGDEAAKGWGKVSVTGEQAVFAAQASEVVDSQVQSLILAFTAVTLLMMILLRSVVLGLVSLIPNIPPVAVIFGMMGWLGIPLDNVTVFAAAIAIGLAVDDTIHYLTQLKREMLYGDSTDLSVEECIGRTYQSTARAMISTSITLFAGFLMLAVTPTKPAIYFGFLGAGAIVTAMLADLLFLPSVILSCSGIREVIKKKMEAERKETVPEEPRGAGIT